MEHSIPLSMVVTPTVPNFIKLTTGGSVAIEKLSNAQLKLIGVLWIHKLLDHARVRRGAKP